MAVKMGIEKDVRGDANIERISTRTGRLMTIGREGPGVL
jgi:hypothetical protein